MPKASPEGIADTTGSTDTTNLATASGVIALSDTGNNALTATLTAPTTTQTGGVAINWSDGDATLLSTRWWHVEILRATIADDGNYSVKLSSPGVITRTPPGKTCNVQSTSWSPTTSPRPRAP